MMSQNPPEPWRPERRWSYLVIASMIAMIFVLLSAQGRVRRLRPPAPDAQVSLEARLEDLVLAAPKVLGSLTGRAVPTKPIDYTEAATRSGWDQALLAVHGAERGERAASLKLLQAAPGPEGDAFRQLWRCAYQDGDAPPAQARREAVRKALGNGYAARILEVRCLARAGAPAQAPEDATRTWALQRLAVLGAAGGLACLLSLAGLGFGLYLALGPPVPRTLPAFSLPGRAVTIVLLGWFLTLLASGPAVGIVLAILPFLRPLALPMAYGFHACLGLTYLCAAEGIDLATLWRRALPSSLRRAALAGLGFFTLAFAAVMAVAMLLSPVLRHAEPPQKELLDLLAHIRGPLAVVLVFLTVAVAAPIFEELLFRGFLLPWLGSRLEARLGPGRGWFLAIAITAVTFGAMHMQPWGMPTLSTLGFVLGLAYVRTGNLGTSILVHGLWNGSVFIVMRMVAS